ncbi:hypothetical protein [Rhizohabitans arisaemae]|uniref:hypothetical protein n=1 Tax=Rhizohabitans arisaemae TaxID=2720610 RepID=UPI0024B1244E|nr:hypothetical protein [Rhizohabitans arisaemae]
MQRLSRLVLLGPAMVAGLVLGTPGVSQASTTTTSTTTAPALTQGTTTTATTLDCKWKGKWWCCWEHDHWKCWKKKKHSDWD